MPENDPVQIDAEKARQGRTGVGVRYVLLGGIVLVLAAWAIIEFVVR
jgi:hypothetical protein